MATSLALRSIGSASATARRASGVSFHATSTLRRSSQLTLIGHDQKRPAGLHHQILGTRERERVGEGRALPAADDDVGAARLRQHESRRKIHGAAPFRAPAARLDRGAELRLQIGQALLDRGLPLIDQSLGLGAIGEIERRGELRCGDPDDAASNRSASSPAT